MLLSPLGFNLCFSFAPDCQIVIGRPRISVFGQLTESESSFFFIMVVIMIYLFVLDGSSTS